MKIVSLQSVGLGRINPKFTAMPVYEELFVAVDQESPLGLYAEKKKVVSIDLVEGEDLPSSKCSDCYYGDTIYYRVTTDDKHVFVLPANKYIAEWVDDKK